MVIVFQYLIKKEKIMYSDKGFTMIELIVTLIIVGILAFVAVPIYRNYVKEGYATEGRALLGEINAAQQIYHSRNGQFYAGTAGQQMGTSFGVDARRNKYFTSYETTKVGDDGYKTVIKGGGAASGISLTLEGSLTGAPKIIENMGD